MPKPSAQPCQACLLAIWWQEVTGPVVGATASCDEHGDGFFTAEKGEASGLPAPSSWFSD